MKVTDVFNNFDRTLEKRRQMSAVLETAFQEAPQEMEELLKVVGASYHLGNIPRFWDVLAILAGADRGYGNDWFFSALELQRQIKEDHE